jgi:hypothetical protein
MGSFVARYVQDVKDLNAWIRGISLYKRVPVLALSTLLTVWVIADYEQVLEAAYPFGSFLVALSALCLVLTPFWIGHDAVHWCCPYGFQRGIV